MKKSKIVKIPENLTTAEKPAVYAQYLGSPKEGSEEHSKAIQAYDGIYRAQAFDSSFTNMAPGISGRPSFSRRDYEAFRPEEAVSRKYAKMIRAIDEVYDSLSIVKSMIDLMSDFGSEGIEVVHPIPAVEKFYKDWFDKVRGVDRSERFLSHLYRHGMVVVRQFNGKVKKKRFSELAIAEDLKLSQMQVLKNDIPLKYLFYNPGDFSHDNYGEIGVDPIYSMADKSKGDLQAQDRIQIPSDRVYVEYYKKDDWKSRPTPFLFPVVKHAIMLEKLALADSAALDGAISKIRIFKLGDMDAEIFPSDAVISKLDSILRSNTGGGTLDMIWGPDIKLIESDTDIHKFLGQEKYTPHLSQVYEGLGIPASFVGVGAGTTNNYISLKILTRRLMSGRRRLINFWDHQMKMVQKSMGFNEPARVEFNHLDLGDEDSERNLLIQLVDRDIISSERLQKILGFDPRMENKRIKRENSERGRGARPDKASQFHSPQVDSRLAGIALTTKAWKPEHAGLVRAPGTEDMKTPGEEFDDTAANSGKPVNPSKAKKGAGGRPNGVKDSTKRKVAEFKPKIKASIYSWATVAQNKIGKVLKPAYLESVGKTALQELTLSEATNFDLIKFGVILDIEPFSDLSKENIVNALGKQVPQDVFNRANDICKDLEYSLRRSLTTPEKRNIYRDVYVSIAEEKDNNDN